ncbi:YceI family protein [Flavobacteriaceae bacterium MHTCC 0001]
MRKISILFIALSLSFASCKKEKKDVKTETETEIATEKFVVKPEATSVKWTAYKTTAKKGVGGEFTSLNFDIKEGTSVEDALNNLNFSIPVSSLFTKDEGRDAKIKEFFFGKMLDTELLKGTIKHDGNSCKASLTMNGVTKDLPLEIKVTDERRVTMTGTINLKDWDALEALASLNQICYELHKGEDGISKTWEDVALEVSTFLRKN